MDNDIARPRNSRGAPTTLDLNMAPSSSQVCETGPALVVHGVTQRGHGILSQQGGTSFVGEKANAALNAVSSDQRSLGYSEHNPPLPSSSGNLQLTDANMADLQKATSQSNHSVSFSYDSEVRSKRLPTEYVMQVPVDEQYNYNEQIRNGNKTSQVQSGVNSSQFVYGHSSSFGGGLDDRFQSLAPMDFTAFSDDIDSLMELEEVAPAPVVTNDQAAEAGIRNMPLPGLPSEEFDKINDFDIRLFEQLGADISMAMDQEQPPSPYDAEIGRSVTQEPVQAMPSPVKTDVYKDSLDCISLMRAKPPFTKGPAAAAAANTTMTEVVYPASPFIPSSPHASLPSPVPSSSYQPPTPLSAYSPAPSTLPPPTPPTPHTPSTPTERCGPFEICTHISGDVRYFEMSASPYDNKALRALFAAYELCQKYSKCMEQVCDLKVAYETCARVCSFKFENEQSKIIFTLPSSCMSLSDWLESNKKSDLVVRHLILQQILNALARVHTLGWTDQLNFCGSLMVWVARDLRVHLLIDFPTLFQKMYSMNGQNHDPRLEDVAQVHKLFQQLILPHINTDATWVSPGMNAILASFESILKHRSSASRMAELARTLGGQRVCRLEVDCDPLTFIIYCIEHEPLAQALSVLKQALYHPLSAARWGSTGREVGSRDVATAGKTLGISLVPIASRPLSGSGLVMRSAGIA